MSEPVGNSPRGENIPNNSHRARAEQVAEQSQIVEPKEDLTKIVTGGVKAQKKSWFHRAARSMIAEDTSSIGDYLVVDVFVPAIRNLVRDLVVGGVDRTLYGSSRGGGGTRIIGGGRSSAGPVSSIRSRYDQMQEERRPSSLSREERARHDFNRIILDSREEAIEVLETLIDRVAQYRAASITDLYDLVGVTGSFADRNWGWTDLATADVRQYRSGWMIELPTPVQLRP